MLHVVTIDRADPCQWHSNSGIVSLKSSSCHFSEFRRHIHMFHMYFMPFFEEGQLDEHQVIYKLQLWPLRYFMHVSQYIDTQYSNAIIISTFMDIMHNSTFSWHQNIWNSFEIILNLSQNTFFNPFLFFNTSFWNHILNSFQFLLSYFIMFHCITSWFHIIYITKYYQESCISNLIFNFSCFSFK